MGKKVPVYSAEGVKVAEVNASMTSIGVAKILKSRTARCVYRDGAPRWEPVA
jgi:hypothetical protein